jgi:hypothetical protein
VSVVKFIPYTNRLAKLIKLPGGKTVEQAMADADANLKEIEGPCLVVLDELIARIRGLAETPQPTVDDLDEIYARSNEIVGLGGVFGMKDLSAAAYSLCELVDRTRDRGGPDRQAMMVHVDSLRLMRMGGAIEEAERAKMLDGLASVVRRVAAG